MKHLFLISIFILYWVETFAQYQLDTLDLAVGDSLIVEVESRGCGFNKVNHAKKYLIYKNLKSNIIFDAISYNRSTYSLQEPDNLSHKEQRLNKEFLTEKNLTLNTEISFDSISTSDLFIGWDEDILEDSVWVKLEHGEYKYTTFFYEFTYSESIDTSCILTRSMFDHIKTVCSVALANENKTLPGGGSLFRFRNVKILYCHNGTRKIIGENYFYDSFPILSVVQ